MDNVFDFRNQLVEEYSTFSRSFAKISALDIRQAVEQEYNAGRYWPQPLIQIGVTPACNSWPATARCIRSVMKFSAPANPKVITAS